MSKRLFHWARGEGLGLTKPDAHTTHMHAGDHAVQIANLTGDVYLVKKEARPDPRELAETIKLHMSLPDKERNSVVQWMREKFKIGLIKDLSRADFGLAQRYIRVVHDRVNSKGKMR